MPAHVDFKPAWPRNFPQRRQHFTLAPAVAEPVKIQQTDSYGLEVRHGGDNAPRFFPCGFVVRRVQYWAGEQEGLGHGVVDGPCETPFDIERADEGESGRECGTGKVP